MSYTVLSFDNDTFTNFAFYSGIVLAKTLIMGPLTSQARIRHKVYGNPEDTKFFAPGVAVNTTDSTVERIRRCHLNDLENVVPFTLIGLLYVSAEPDYDKALMIFRVFAASRILHTISYLVPLPQPARASCFFVGWGATAAMTAFLFARMYKYV
ncbi:hypothetical protein BaRGS_00004347 [Batillaria attramentaria]|uniref:Microsomal glutathione S-transferase 1 n=1 Tax=Batillaria attramentaria TaxID=370345 RepID=A0ABD0LZA0_9CAEN